MSFARALRAILRQDPDVIMIGEIRDLETAQIAVQASLTGHLVLATLHTNDTTSSVTRLTDMGVEPFLLSSSLLGVLAQRLVRCLCLNCRAAYAPDAGELALLEGLIPTVLYRPVGCAVCGNSGYRKRTGIYELMRVDDGMRRLIHNRTAEQNLREYAVQNGMLGLRQDGLRLVLSGITSLEELLRVSRE
jgi:general secretion pathway protein E